MKRSCHFKMNPAFAAGITVNFFGILLRYLTETTGMRNHLFCWIQGFAIGLLCVGLLYGSAKTQSLFHRFHAFKLRLLDHS